MYYYVGKFFRILKKREALEKGLPEVKSEFCLKKTFLKKAGVPMKQVIRRLI